MTFSTSEVAVCCSSDSLNSRVRACTSSNKRTFLDRYHRLVGERFREFDLFVGERPYRAMHQRKYTNRRSFSQKRYTEGCAIAPSSSGFPQCVL